MPDKIDHQRGTPLLTYRGHSNRVNAVAWSPNSLRVASAGYDGRVRVWDATTGGDAFTYHEHSNGVNAVAWSPTGLRIASASTDGTVKVWQAV